MITGYNTDVRHRGTVFHIQTEDKGVNNPSIETLVYVGGQILHRKRSEYAKLLKEGGGKEEILELLEAQHRAVIKEIKNNEKEMSDKNKTSRNEGLEKGISNSRGYIFNRRFIYDKGTWDISNIL